jgi:hypothetical protein
MRNLNRAFANRLAIPTREAAALAETNEATARALAPELCVQRIGTAFAWSRENVENLAARLEPEDDDDEEEDEEDDDDDDEQEQDEDEQDEDARDEDDDDAA